MRRLLIAIAAALMLALGFVTPAQANHAGILVHYSPDDGYNAPFRISSTFSNGQPSAYTYLVAEGRTSSSYMFDVAAIYVQDGQEIWCNGAGGWANTWDATGWYRIGDNHFSCVSHAD